MHIQFDRQRKLTIKMSNDATENRKNEAKENCCSVFGV